MRLIFAVLPLLALAGCSSYQADPDKVTQVPSDRVLAYQQPAQNTGQIVVNRDLGMLGGGCYVAVLVDRQVAARIAIGEAVSLHVPPGNRVLGIGIDKQDDTLCGMGRLRREVAVRVTEGESQQFRIVSQNKGGFDIKPVTP
ncbi:3-isopropylmalate dehydratase [Pseudomonas sp. UBA2684]|uniref:3-isopropylmalate dehydratase n=1 Tax=Pseudomonas sp. UBA2684 TaxID=1947311 RepID=UPI000E8B5C96|nr:3-isopropylmalate dehydratase [Pseudomonas sp. UBA2684]HBX57588.1 3-isopropylmalate dehydratase [Pseudomonas sp.]|tara:strand:- start:15586 stop:16011 length:426 start_codon:yes stop_codon:yes gene_type:complete